MQRNLKSIFLQLAYLGLGLIAALDDLLMYFIELRFVRPIIACNVRPWYMELQQQLKMNVACNGLFVIQNNENVRK